ncbi:hypothetical protein KY334_04105 [Candidatus Woesearchaeota archaeon]|nr:hypothetical protein [Candidatus Woesearchaeota archaeon]
MPDEFKVGLVAGIIFIFGILLGIFTKEWEIYKSCEQKQEYRISNKTALSCKVTTLELNK